MTKPAAKSAPTKKKPTTKGPAKKKRTPNMRKRTRRHTPTEEEIDEVVDGTFPCSDPPSFNPGRATPSG